VLHGVKHRFHVDYVNPIDYIDTSKFAQVGITACVTGQLYVVDKDFGEIFLGHIVHIVQERGVGYYELISRMWLGHIDKQPSGGAGGGYTFPPPSLVNYFANSTVYRYFGLSNSWARSYWIHLVQEMGLIANLLPIFYPIEVKNLQERKENFPNGLVLDEVKNHLRNLARENPYLEQQLQLQQQVTTGAGAGVGGVEYKSNELPRPLTVYSGSGLEPWEATLGGGGDESVDSGRGGNGNRSAAVAAPNRNSSLRARQLHQTTPSSPHAASASSSADPPPHQSSERDDAPALSVPAPAAVAAGAVAAVSPNPKPLTLSQRIQAEEEDDSADDEDSREGEDQLNDDPGGGGGGGAPMTAAGSENTDQHPDQHNTLPTNNPTPVAVSYATNELGGGVDI
jgi:hypothetical protein